jgi:CPA2 family monovalent cation:H+ antiporter-2
MDSDPLVTMVVGGIVAAFVLGFIAHKLRISPIVGYLLAGVMIGPYTPGFIADGELAGELAELGIILIMFGVGLKFSPAKLIAYRWIALPCALGQMILVTAFGLGIASLFGMGWIEGLIFGFSLSIASTVVLLRALEDRYEIASPAGHLAVSWLIVQDIAAVFVLLVMSALAQRGIGVPEDAGATMRAIGMKAAELGLFVLIMAVIGRRILPGLLVFIARAKSRELFSLGVFSMALGIAYAAHAIFGASFALGAFVAGLVLNEAAISHRAAEDLIPLRDAFAVLFFVSVGMLFDPQILVTQRWALLAVVAVIILGNGGAALLMTTALRVPAAQRAILAGGLAQIGEFSFLISGTALSLDLISQNAFALVSAGAVLAIALNPFIRDVGRLLTQRNEGAAEEADAADPA